MQTIEHLLMSISDIQMPACNWRFGASGAVARPKVCADLEVFRPSERQWKPRLRQAAGTLHASGERQCGGQSRENLNAANNSKFRKYLQFINLEVARHGLGRKK